MTSTYKVEHENGTSTVEGVHAFWFPAGHLVFLNEEGNTFAGFAAGTWHSFKKVEVEVEVEVEVDDATTNLHPVGTWVSSTLYSDTFGPVVKVEGTLLTIRPVAVGADGSDYTISVQYATDVLTRDQVFKLPVGTRVKSTGDLSEFEVVEDGVAWVTYSGGIPRPDEYQHPDDLECITDITEFKVIA